MFEGVFSALITPFEDGRLDRAAFQRLIEYQIAEGISGVVPCGTTGESATLSHDEHKEVISAAIEIVDGRVPVIAGTGSNATHESIELTKFAKEAGADAALLITPYYNKPTQQGLIAHYTAVADAVEIPQILYNVPGRTALDMQAETVAALADHPNIVAIKEATADLERASFLKQMCGDRLTLISGDDATFFPFLCVGGRGVISVSANIATRKMAALFKGVDAGDYAAARKEHEDLLALNSGLFCETSPIPIKACCHMLGLTGPELRLPLTPISEANAARLKGLMDALGLFDVVKAHL